MCYHAQSERRHHLHRGGSFRACGRVPGTPGWGSGTECGARTNGIPGRSGHDRRSGMTSKGADFSFKSRFGIRPVLFKSRLMATRREPIRYNSRVVIINSSIGPLLLSCLVPACISLLICLPTRPSPPPPCLPPLLSISATVRVSQTNPSTPTSHCPRGPVDF